MSFHVGQRVVCVDAEWPTSGKSPLSKGTVYTVTKCFVGHYYNGGAFPTGQIGELVELAETSNPSDDARGFKVSRFRPLDESRLDIFRAMLVSPPKVPA